MGFPVCREVDQFVVLSDSHRYICRRIVGRLDDWWIRHGCIRVVDKCLGECVRVSIHVRGVHACVQINRNERVSS